MEHGACRYCNEPIYRQASMVPVTQGKGILGYAHISCCESRIAQQQITRASAQVMYQALLIISSLLWLLGIMAAPILLLAGLMLHWLTFPEAWQ